LNKVTKSTLKTNTKPDLINLSEQLPPIIPKEILFGNPDRSSPRLSPDGKSLAFLAPSQDNVLNVFVRNLATGVEEQITQDTDRGITGYQWHYNNTEIFFIQDNKGNE
jgi:Tol biopolymer transport system component